MVVVDGVKRTGSGELASSAAKSIGADSRCACCQVQPHIWQEYVTILPPAPTVTAIALPSAWQVGQCSSRFGVLSRGVSGMVSPPSIPATPATLGRVELVRRVTSCGAISEPCFTKRSVPDIQRPEWPWGPYAGNSCALLLTFTLSVPLLHRGPFDYRRLAERCAAPTTKQLKSVAHDDNVSAASLTFQPHPCR